jgi:hypothetical protein
MMHHGMLFQQLSSKPHAKDKHRRAARPFFCRKSIEACEAKEHGHDSKQRHHVEGPIMQVKEWMREFGQCNPWSTQAQKSQSKDECAGRKPSQGGEEATQAGWPTLVGLPLFKHPRCSPLAGKLLIQLSVCVLEFVVQNHLRLSHPSQVFSSKKTHPNSTQSLYSEINFVCLVTG